MDGGVSGGGNGNGNGDGGKSSILTRSSSKK